MIAAWLLTITALILFGLALAMIIRAASKNDYAPGWQVRCRACGKTKLASELGIIRLGAFGSKPILVECSTCNEMRWAMLERIPQTTKTEKAVKITCKNKA